MNKKQVRELEQDFPYKTGFDFEDRDLSKKFFKIVNQDDDDEEI